MRIDDIAKTLIEDGFKEQAYNMLHKGRLAVDFNYDEIVKVNVLDGPPTDKDRCWIGSFNIVAKDFDLETIWTSSAAIIRRHDSEAYTG